MRRISILLFIVSVVAFLPFACTQKTAEETANTSTDDSRISSEIESRITADSSLTGHEIEVDTDDGVVTLNGEVSTQAEAETALNIANSVTGVRSVRSHIRVNPESASAGEGESFGQEVEELGETAKKEAEELGETAKQKTEEYGERAEKGLEDLGEAAKDASITAEVKLKLAADDRVSASAIDVDTENGTVTLTGTVRTQAEANRAVQLARGVENVVNVRSKLTVKGAGS